MGGAERAAIPPQLSSSSLSPTRPHPRSFLAHAQKESSATVAGLFAYLRGQAERVARGSEEDSLFGEGGAGGGSAGLAGNCSSCRGAGAGYLPR